MKTPELVVPDIYQMLESGASRAENREHILDTFAEECRAALDAATRPPEPREGLRLSSIGKPNRKIWNEFWGIKGEDLDGPTYIKFLYGHLVEALVIGLAELADHEVTEKQKTVEVEGVQGHQDGRLDGVLFDVKSASNYGFKKFKQNRLHEDDPFGYIAQLKAYAYQENDTRYGWLALDKSTGELAWLEYDETDQDSRYFEAVNWDVAERVREIKKIVEGPLPSKCYEDITEGRSGNRRLQSGCVYCAFKHTCWPGLRIFNYAGGPKYLTHVEKDPRVQEAPSDF
jgi:hypothetical protein